MSVLQLSSFDIFTIGNVLGNVGCSLTLPFLTSLALHIAVFPSVGFLTYVAYHVAVYHHNHPKVLFFGDFMCLKRLKFLKRRHDDPIAFTRESMGLTVVR